MDKYPPDVRSRMMSAVRSRGNRSTERRLRAYLIQAGLRGWTVQPRGVVGCPDFVFEQQKIAIFIDGAFWHGAPGFKRFPQTRVVYWNEKIERNRGRDKVVNCVLRRRGWSVLRFWDYELVENPDAVIRSIRCRLEQRSRPQSKDVGVAL